MRSTKPLQRPLPGLLQLLRRNFLAGVFVLIPFLVVAWVLGKVLRAIGSFRTLIPEAWRPEMYFDAPTASALNFLIAVGLTLVFALAVSLLGWLSKQYLGDRILKLLGRIVRRIPVIRSIYSSLDPLLRTMAAGGKQQFNRVVYVEYPRAGSYAIAFVTSEARGMGAGYLNLYVPTTPNPTSGFHLIVPEKDVRDAHMSVEDAFKTIISLGIAQSDVEAR